MWKKIKTKIVYPKLILFAFCMVLAAIFFEAHIFDDISYRLNHHGYASIFLAGMLFSYGFTTPFAIGMFLAIGDDVNLLIAAPLAAFGALLSDLLIFEWIHTSFQDEFDRLKRAWPFRSISHILQNKVSFEVRKYVTYAFAGIIIASPFPDEFGVSLISGFTTLNRWHFAIISYLCNLVGIALFLSLA